MQEFEVTFTTQVEASVKVKARSAEEALERIENSDVYDFIHKAYDFSYSNWDLQLIHAREII